MSKSTKEDFVRLENCLACESQDLRTILDLGLQPLANSYHQGEELSKYPLQLNVCQNCFHLQLSCAINPDLMFRNYLYVSGTSETLRKYFDFFAEKTLEYFPEAKEILDIACNDGSQLDSYKKIGLGTHGIDPASNLFEDCLKKGHEVICDYFNQESLKKFGNRKFDIITAQNVFAHTRHVEDFLLACKKIMHDQTHLFIQTSQANMVVNNEFDTIYHEHVSFFNSFSMKTLVERCGLHLVDIFKTDVHGTSYVFVISSIKKEEKPGVQLNLNSEEKLGILSPLTYPKYALNCYIATENLAKKIVELKNEGYLVAGYGAAAKGNTLLNFGNIQLDFILDDNPLKQELLTPGRNIRILGPNFLESISEEQKIAFVPLAWNFYEEIKRRIQKIRNVEGDLFLKYFPTLTIEKR
jgi:2-polyprenyl-3-methyl-5-hydroxy-6-metoxy-1,4-benzoquinol methylase